MTDQQRPADDGGPAEPIEPIEPVPGRTDRRESPAGPQFSNLGEQFSNLGGLSELGELLGPEAAETIGTVAEEALKLFAVARDRFGEVLADADADAEQAESVEQPGDAAAGGPPSPWAGLLGQLAAGAVKAVEDFAAAAQEQPAGSWTSESAEQPGGSADARAGDTQPGGAGETRSGKAAGPGPVHPGQAAACSYCPVCQGIALVRSVPTETWQRLAVSVVEMADAARNMADAAEGVADQQPGSRSAPSDVVIHQEDGPDHAAGLYSVTDFLESLEPTEEPPQA